MHNFKNQTHFSRQALERIAKLSVNKPVRGATAKERKLGILLSSLTRNRLLAKNKIYKKNFEKNKDYIHNWLWLKKAVGDEVIHTLLLRQDKMSL